VIGPGRASIEAHGGTPLVIGDVKESMVGSQVANLIVVVEFPAIEAVSAWRDSEDGARVREAIERNAVFHGSLSTTRLFGIPLRQPAVTFITSRA
jgi:uncharacterized protein (DUF1330 family)